MHLPSDNNKKLFTLVLGLPLFTEGGIFMVDHKTESEDKEEAKQASHHWNRHYLNQYRLLSKQRQLRRWMIEKMWRVQAF
jgi:hypothetical protein